MDNEGLSGDSRLNADPAHRPNSDGGIGGVPSDNAVKQDNGARVFALIALFLFACYFLGALAVSG
jgi:hypothetical protein